MSTPTGEGLPAGAQETTPLLVAMEQLDLSEQAYFAVCTEFSRHPTADNEATVLGTAISHAEAAELFLDALAEEATLEGYQSTATQFMLTTDGQRVETLNQLLGTDVLKKMDSLTEIPLHEDPSFDEDTLKHILGATVFGVFEHNLHTDTAEFIRTVGDSGPARRMQRNERIKAHAVDLGKIAAGGIVSGLVVAFLSRRRA